jgi:glucuronoarabinoxylan endo-1,4-beta-xylanase
MSKAKIIRGICLSCFIGTLFWSCTDVNEPNQNDTNDQDHIYAKFQQEKIFVLKDSGEISIHVNWSETEWEVKLKLGDFVTAISQTEGGNELDQDQTTIINLTYSQNKEPDYRTQKISITNKTTGQVSNLILEQAPDGLKEYPVNIDPSVKYQHVVGFGGMYNPVIWTGSFLITNAELAKMYGPKGLGYSILRLMIYPNKSNWEADVEAARYAQQQGVVIFASPWDCTDALADQITLNGEKVKHLKHENYGAYAQHLIDYINFMKSKGVSIYAISMQNEPDMNFTYWTPNEVVNFVKQYGALIRKTGVKLMTPEACGTHPDYTDPILNDVQAFDNTDILVGHFYQGFVNTENNNYARKRYEYIIGLYDRLQGKTFWMTEHLFNDGEKESDPSMWEFQKWHYNLNQLGKEIIESMKGNVSAYVYWYLKRFYGMMGDNDERSPVPSGEITKNGYIMSHFAKYASNMTRIRATTLRNVTDLSVTAYVNEEGSEITLVMINYSNGKTAVNIPVSGVTDVQAVETTQNKNMEEAEFRQLDNSIYLILSEQSIVSVRLTL